jgi:hypothetical protein
MNTKRKNILVLIVLLPLLFFSFLKPIYAQEETEEVRKWWDLRAGWEELVEWSSALTGNFFEDIQKLLAKMPYAVTSNLVAEAAPELTTSYDDIMGANISDSYKRGFVGIMNDQLAAMFQAYPQVDVVAHLTNEWVPGQKDAQMVYATGYDDLQKTGVDSLWSQTRNIAYLGFVVIMIGIGFMIMFRSKIGGQTLVTIGNSIPRVVVALILVTFSFAIIGLIIDVAGVSMNVIGGILDLEHGVNPMNFLDLLKGVIGIEGAGGVETAVTFSAIGVAGSVLMAIPGVGTVASFFWNLVILILLGIITFGVIKLWFALVKSYLALLVNVLVAPLAIMVGAFPGSQHVTMNMFKSALRNAFVFPLAFAIVNLPFAIDPGQTSLDFPATLNPQAVMDVNIGPLILGVAKIIAIYVAAQSPVFMKAIIPASAPKSGVDAAGAISESLQKMPLFGGLFKSK